MSCNCIRVDTNSTEPLENLLRFVSINVPELPYEVAMDLLRQSYIEFGRLTQLLVSHFELPLQKGVKDYILEPPEGYEIYGLLDIARHNHTYLKFPNVDTWYFSWGQRFKLVGNNILVFADEPTRDDLKKTIALHLLPTDCVEQIPIEISSPFGEGIAAGAIRRGLEIPNKAWTNLNLAQLKRRDFSRAALAGRNISITKRGSVSPEFKPVRII